MGVSLAQSRGFAHQRAVRGDKGGAQIGGEAGQQRLEDIVGELEPVNMPGVPQERFSSWTRRLAVPLEALRERDDVAQALGGVR